MIINLTQIYNNMNEYEENNLARKQTELKIITNDMNKISDSIFENIINTKDVIKIFQKAHTATDLEKQIIRNDLYNLLKYKYETFTKFGIQQLHFHLPNNDSFLRFHKPSKYGDNLTSTRESVKYVSTYEKPTVGFEEGKIFNGYRFVYPLFDENKEYIGSVEISSSLLTFKKIIEEHKHSHIDYILRKDVVEKKVFKDQLKNYANYPYLKNFLIQTTLRDYNQKDLHLKERNEILNELSKDDNLIKKIDNFEEFFDIKIHNFKVYTTSFIPLVNDFTSQKVGYIVIFAQSEYFKYSLNSYIITLLIILLLSIMVGYIFYKKDLDKELILKKSIEYKAILDLYENIVLIVDSEIIVNSNNKFLNFFNINNINQLGEKLKIKNFFSKNDEFFSPKSGNIVEELKSIDISKREVNLVDSKGNSKIFSIYAHYIDSQTQNSYIIELIDITEHKKETNKLQEKAYLDKLTGIYNRHYFESTIETNFNHMKKIGSNLSLIMFDIDHFKLVNDQFGHNIGDDSLVFLSNLFKNNIREKDIFCRWGGEEFMILTTNTLEESVKMAENLRKAIDNETKRNEKIPHFSCSFGVVSLTDFNTPKEGIEKVDKLLYKSKENGRNMVSY